MTNDQCSPLPYTPHREFLTPENLNRLNVNTDVEALLLSWMINSPEEVKKLDPQLHHLQSADFSYDDTATLFKDFMSVLDQVKAFDPESEIYDDVFYPLVRQRYVDSVQPEMAVKLEAIYFNVHQNNVPLTVVTSWIESILNRSCWNKVYKISRRMMEVSMCPNNVVFNDFMAKSSAALNNVMQRSTLELTANSHDLIELSLEYLNNAQSGVINSESSKGLLTGFSELDTMLDGLQAGKLYVLAARPSVGKSAFALNLLKNVAERNSLAKPIMLFSLEMEAKELTKRLTSSVLKASIKDIETQAVSTCQINKCTETLSQLTFGKYGLLLVDDSGTLTSNVLASKIRNYTQQFGYISMIAIDYLQLMVRDRNAPAVNRNLELANMTRQLKILAKDYNCPVLLLSQLNREIETRDDHSPKLSDLRDSGAIEQDADVVMFLSNSGNDFNREIVRRDLIVAKNRSGRIGNTNLFFRGAWTLFAEKEEDLLDPHELSEQSQDTVTYASV